MASFFLFFWLFAFLIRDRIWLRIWEFQGWSRKFSRNLIAQNVSGCHILFISWDSITKITSLQLQIAWQLLNLQSHKDIHPRAQQHARCSTTLNLCKLPVIRKGRMNSTLPLFPDWYNEDAILLSPGWDLLVPLLSPFFLRHIEYKHGFTSQNVSVPSPVCSSLSNQNFTHCFLHSP